jgi:dGTPase
MKYEKPRSVSLSIDLLEAGLSPLAQRTALSRGRERPEEPCGLRTIYQRDRDRIVHSKSFRRLKHKTQVFISPEGDHYRTRLTHTLEVSGIARTVARALRLNEDLAEAIAMGHDLGHTPFGHAGEAVLDDMLRELGEAGFAHNEQSLRVVDLLENDGRGLNLTWEVRDGILCHTGAQQPATLEGKVTRVADRIAYINHDIDDALRAGLITRTDFPAEAVELLGRTGSERIDTLVHDLVDNSLATDDIVHSEDIGRAMEQMRLFLFETVYTRSLVETGEQRVRHLITLLMKYLLEHPGTAPGLSSVGGAGDERSRVRAAADYVAGMTDRYAQKMYVDLFVPDCWAGR